MWRRLSARNGDDPAGANGEDDADGEQGEHARHERHRVHAAPAVAPIAAAVSRVATSLISVLLGGAFPALLRSGNFVPRAAI